jgi:hypothetical protein
MRVGWRYDETIVGKRIGPADASLCGPAAEAAWARMRAIADTMAIPRR